LALFCALKLPAQQKKLDEQRRMKMAGIDFEIIDRNHSNAALGTGKTGSGRAGTEIRSCLSPEALADYQ
jgi:hypothetical protein